MEHAVAVAWSSDEELPSGPRPDALPNVVVTLLSGDVWSFYGVDGQYVYFRIDGGALIIHTPRRRESRIVRAFGPAAWATVAGIEPEAPTGQYGAL